MSFFRSQHGMNFNLVNNPHSAFRIRQAPEKLKGEGK